MRDSIKVSELEKVKKEEIEEKSDYEQDYEDNNGGSENRKKP